MNTLLLYDITHDGIRSKVASACEDYGLDRIQYSAFLGRLSRTHQEELMLKIRDLLGKENGRIQLIVLPRGQWDQRLEVVNDVVTTG